MVKVIKYMQEIAVVGATCGEGSEKCENSANMHVCFEDGGGVTLCKSCFESRVNEGLWITDGTQILLVS